jgi:hypothetical protein
MKKSESDRFTLGIPVGREVIGFILLFGVAVFLRLFCLSADPPHGISSSTGIETDPPQYTLCARNAVLIGDDNPYGDNRYVSFHHSLVAYAGQAVLGLLGTGVYQINLVGALLSLLAILAFYFFIRRALGNGTAVLMLFFIAINYLAIFFGRRPFLENGMSLLFILGLLALAYGDKKWYGHFLFGVGTAAAVIFGKIIALAFLSAPAAYYLYRRFYLGDKTVLRHAAVMSGGMGSVTAVWFLVLYLPNAGAISGYVGEEAFGLHGYPEGLRSVGNFIIKFFAFGADTMFFERMPVISIGALTAVILLAGMIWSGTSRGREDRPDYSMMVVLAAWLIGTFVGEVPWNYMPVRYQVIMIYPMAALTAAAVVYIHSLGERVRIFNRSIVFSLVALVGALLVVSHISRMVVISLGGVFSYTGYIPYIAAGVMVAWAVYIYAARRRPDTTVPYYRFSRYVTIFLMVGLSIIIHGQRYVSWASMPLYTARQASRDLGMILSPSAVVAGPYAPALTMENDFGCMIHYFSTDRADSAFFSRHPVTHLLLDGGNLYHARVNYPDLMKGLAPIGNYNINCNRVWLYRIAERSGNPSAARYELSDFEKMIMYIEGNNDDSALVYLEKFLGDNPNNLNGNLAAALYFESVSDHNRAISHCRRALDYSFTEFNLHFLLGKLYINRANATGDESIMELGEKAIEIARKYSFDRVDFDDYINK